jgi:serine/threonine-protein kinase TNNI3K
LSIFDRLYLAIGCANGLKALHQFNGQLCHRDVKSFNFLVDHQLNAKIADLELGTSPVNENKAGTIKGDEILANWAAPEVIAGEPYTQAADIYSFALVLWEILSGKQPFSHIKKQSDIRKKVRKNYIYIYIYIYICKLIYFII